MDTKSKEKCVVCGRSGRRHKPFVPVTYIDRDSQLHTAQLLCAHCLCGRSLTCSQCHQSLLVFIDASLTCPDCVKRHMKRIWQDKGTRAMYSKIYQEVSLQVPPGDIEEVLKLVQAGIEEPEAEPERCWVAALAVYSYRFSLKMPQVLERVKAELVNTKSLVAALLPSGDAAKRYTPQRP